MRFSTIGVLYDVGDERERQNEKWGEQNHTPMEWLPILMEEVGEVAKAALEQHFSENGYDQYTDVASLQELRKEMVQVAAVAVAMVESLDRNQIKKVVAV